MIDRLPPPWGQFLDRETPVAFRFEERLVRGYAGDTLASALAARDVWLLSRSSRFRRARGPMSFAGHEAAGRVTVDGQPDVPADLCPAADGLLAYAQLPAGGLEGLRGTWLRRLERLLPAGFAREALFQAPPGWPFWEARMRRRAAGGRLDLAPPLAAAPAVEAETGVAVVGGGPAGLMAALAAAAAGAPVTVLEQWPQAGGSLNWGRFGIDPGLGGVLRDRLRQAVEAQPRITLVPGARVLDIAADRSLLVQDGGRPVALAAGAVVLATGTIPQPLVFRSNDYPGIAMADGLQRLLRLWAVRPGERAVVVTAHDEGYGAALDLDDAGVAVMAVLDLRRDPADGPCRREAARRRLDLRTGACVVEAGGSRSLTRLAGIRLGRVTEAGGWEESGEIMPCDLLAMAVGGRPDLRLAEPLGAGLARDPAAAPGAEGLVADLPDGLFAAGGANGCVDLASALGDGERAGARAALWAGHADGTPLPEIAIPPGADSSAPAHPFPLFAHPGGREFVDFDRDLTLADLSRAMARGLRDEVRVSGWFDLGATPGAGALSRLNIARFLGRARRDGRIVLPAPEGGISGGLTLGALAARAGTRYKKN